MHFLHKTLIMMMGVSVLQGSSSERYPITNTYNWPVATHVGTGAAAGVLGAGLALKYGNPYVTGTAGATLATLLAKRAWDTVSLSQKYDNALGLLKTPAVSTLSGLLSGLVLAKIVQNRGWNPYILAAAAAGTGALCGWGAQYGLGNVLLVDKVDEYHKKQIEYINATKNPEVFLQRQNYSVDYIKDKNKSFLEEIANLGFLPDLNLEKKFARRMSAASEYISEDDQGLFYLKKDWSEIKHDDPIIKEINLVLTQARGETIFNWKKDYRLHDIESILNKTLQPYNYEKILAQRFVEKNSNLFSQDKNGLIEFKGNQSLSYKEQLDFLKQNSMKKPEKLTTQSFIESVNTRIQPLHWYINKAEKLKEEKKRAEDQEFQRKREDQKKTEDFVASITQNANSKSLTQWRNEALLLPLSEQDKELIKRAYTTEQLIAITQGDVSEKIKKELGLPSLGMNSVAKFQDLFNWAKLYTVAYGNDLTENMAKELKENAIQSLKKSNKKYKLLEISMLDAPKIRSLFNNSFDANGFINLISSQMSLREKFFELKNLFITETNKLLRALALNATPEEIKEKILTITDIQSFASDLIEGDIDQVLDNELKREFYNNLQEDVILRFINVVPGLSDDRRLMDTHQKYNQSRLKLINDLAIQN